MPDSPEGNEILMRFLGTFVTKVSTLIIVLSTVRNDPIVGVYFILEKSLDKLHFLIGTRHGVTSFLKLVPPLIAPLHGQIITCFDQTEFNGATVTSPATVLNDMLVNGFGGLLDIKLRDLHHC
jgi:hypothetical protein